MYCSNFPFLLLCGSPSIFCGSCSRFKEVVNDLLEDAELLLDKCGARLFVAPLPARRLFSSDGLLAHMNAWNDETVKTPKRFKIPFVVGVT